MSEHIEFMIEPELDGVTPPPVPASRLLPEWFKRMPAYPALRDDEPMITTAKRCSPFRDALTEGFIMTLPWAVRVVARQDGSINFSWQGSPPFGNPIQTHGEGQVEGYPADVPLLPFKFINPWIVKTPPGWSTLFTSLINRGETRFDPFTGYVDTDVYHNAINFPFLWRQYPYEGVLDAGTPILQAIPVKRTEFTHDARVMTAEEVEEKRKNEYRLFSHHHHYTRNIRCPRGKASEPEPEEETHGDRTPVPEHHHRHDHPPDRRLSYEDLGLETPEGMAERWTVSGLGGDHDGDRAVRE